MLGWVRFKHPRSYSDFWDTRLPLGDFAARSGVEVPVAEFPCDHAWKQLEKFISMPGSLTLSQPPVPKISRYWTPLGHLIMCVLHISLLVIAKVKERVIPSSSFFFFFLALSLHRAPLSPSTFCSVRASVASTSFPLDKGKGRSMVQRSLTGQLRPAAPNQNHPKSDPQRAPRGDGEEKETGLELMSGWAFQDKGSSWREAGESESPAHG